MKSVTNSSHVIVFNHMTRIKTSYNLSRVKSNPGRTFSVKRRNFSKMSHISTHTVAITSTFPDAHLS